MCHLRHTPSSQTFRTKKKKLNSLNAAYQYRNNSHVILVPIFGILFSDQRQICALSFLNKALRTSEWTGEQSSHAKDKIS